MTRSDAARELHALTVGLTPDAAGVERLLERVAQGDKPEELRAALTEMGAERLLYEAQP
jgi:hypothetical protein